METKITNPVKTEKELVRFHKQLLTRFLKEETQLSFQKRVTILKLYDNRINENNIRYYFNAKIKIFLSFMLMDRLQEIKSYYQADHE